MSGLRYEVDGSIATITLDRPERRNALALPTLDALARAWRDAEDDDAVRAVILTGTGDRAFCAGADLKESWTDAGSTHEAFFPERLTMKPLIAAVNGACVAGGVELLLACDVRYAADHATFALTEASLGLFPAGGSAVRAPRRLAWPHAMYLLLTSDKIDSVEAARIGLVNRAVPLPELMPLARATAEMIARNSPATLRAIKQAALGTDGMPLLDALTKQSEFVKPGSVDGAAGIARFKGDRP
ncbi:MAG: enoyl-CoA hydratase/isomerase family protein [Actinobacteria bacterium]|nr:enoyl-CoA hydratase/isomerase family protein [Actinomycetota bacterium]